jgi:phosphoribosylamine--glycine ligase
VLGNFDLRWHDATAMCVVMANQGYPGTYSKGSVIGNLASAAADDRVTVFHAGTARDGNNIVATGGRVLNVTALGDDVADARARAYDAVDKIDWPEGFFRHDIGWRALKRK